MPNNHRFRWILFVRPIVGNKFTDRSFLSKVEVELHPTFTNPYRVLKEPPFELEETGYASFTPKLTIYFNTPHAKPYPVQYDMNLKLGRLYSFLSPSENESKNPQTVYTKHLLHAYFY
ncbi:unnamed protein product [Cylicostephanus goldi]|uniref:YEATS domain-containing protein n=1 Tax=Cylicostephanus goldi TaxID=71465 RepID=A0A3P6TYR3_CYLGO|nr:unnamed protein product [Cylicostephanus goldi]